MRAIGLTVVICLLAAAGYLTPRAGYARAGSGGTFPPLLPAPEASSLTLLRLIHADLPARRTVRVPHDVSSANDLAIPAGNWPPGTTNLTGQPLTDTQLDALTGSAHQTTYESAGAMGGYRQSATIPLNASGATMQLLWVGSYYGTAQQAAAWENDALTGPLTKSGTFQICNPAFPTCHVLNGRSTSNGVVTDVSYAIFAEGNAVGELVYFAADADVQANPPAYLTPPYQLAVAGDAQLRRAAGIAATSSPTPAPPPTATPTSPPAATPTSTGVAPATVAPGGTPGAALGIASDKWPTGSTVVQDSVADAALADSKFGADHSVSYESAQMQGGRFQEVYIPFSSTDAMELRWLGSYYPTAEQAQARVQDALNVAKRAGRSVANCSATWSGCHIVNYQFSAAGIDGIGWYVVVAEGNTVGEMVYTTTRSVWQAHQAELGNDATQILDAGDAVLLAAVQGQGGIPVGTLVPTATPAPTATLTPVPLPTVSIDSITLTHTVKGKSRATTTLRSNEHGTLAVKYHLANAGTASIAGTVTFLRGNRVLKHARLSLHGSVLSTGVKFAAGKKALHLIAEVTLTLGAASDTQPLSFVVRP